MMQLKTSDSLEGKRSKLQSAVEKHYAKKKGGKSYAWIHDVFPKHVVVDHKGRKFAHRYSEKNGECSLGPGVEVEVVYRPKSVGREEWKKELE